MIKVISDEERREIVRKLRFQLNCMRVIDERYAEDAYPVERGNMTYRNIAWSLVESGNRIHGNYCDIMERLISLIEQPTDRDISGVEGQMKNSNEKRSEVH